ncbi:MAG: hypothetical protein E7D44_00835 [Eggerthella sp.]|nr:hypothetical protein [Eggerthella sp.]
MLHFDSDYMEGAHPAILERLAATNFDQTSGYGTDEVCAAARERIREACACPHANVYFLVGGTQANAAVGADVTLADIARLCDAFYIGGTKVGAFCGEAVVFTKPGLDDHFFTLMKKRGALLAKGRFLGLQFDVLFGQEDGELRYQHIGRHAVELAQRIAEGFRAKDYELAIDSPTNQQFVILDDETKERLAEHASFGFWERTPDGRTVVRFATSWATRPESVNELLALL